MNIVYINGYSEGTYTGTKYKTLSTLLNEKITLVEYKYKDNNIKEIEEKIKNADLVIASSTGAYLARNICYKHNLPLIALNPVINLEETFNKIGVDVPKIPNGNNKNLRELILVSEDDELINPLKTLEKFKTQTILILICQLLPIIFF